MDTTGVSQLLARGCGTVYQLRQPDVEIGQFRWLLKTFLFERDCGAQRLFCLYIGPFRSSLTYLLTYNISEMRQYETKVSAYIRAFDLCQNRPWNLDDFERPLRLCNVEK